MGRIRFPDDFVWGAATASYQIEGAAFEDGKGESIWDRFSHTPGMIFDATTGDTACGHYHLFESDIALMKELGLKAYRLSVSWPRIFPDGAGNPNPKGLEFYKKVLRRLRENGIKTAVTLYHWDLPQKLQDKGGWTNRETAAHFERYARRMFRELDGLVDWWITINEPFCVAFLGYWMGVHAPGVRDFSAALLAAHHVMLAHGGAARAFRELGVSGELGITLNMSRYYPAGEGGDAKNAAKLADAAWNLWFSDPILKGAYPETALERYRGRVPLPEIQPGDLELISSPIDFLGLNSYFSISCASDKKEWPLGVKQDFMGVDRTEMGWGIHPEGFYDILVYLRDRYGDIPVYITENGCAFNDIVDVQGEVRDYNRVDYFRRYLAEAHRALSDGVNLKGYFAWSLLDNFEWERGLSKRFGLIHVDYKTLKRTIKKSGRWYSGVIERNGFEL